MSRYDPNCAFALDQLLDRQQNIYYFRPRSALERGTLEVRASNSRMNYGTLSNQ